MIVERQVEFRRLRRLALCLLPIGAGTYTTGDSMTFYTHCPQCGTDIPQDRFSTGFAICQCGWYDDTLSERSVKKSEKQAIITMVALAFVLVLGYAHLTSWGNYAGAIPFVELEKITGTLSKEGYEELAKACIDLGKFDCAKSAYLGEYESKGAIEGLAGLARLQMRLGEMKEASASYATYFARGGDQSDAALFAGKLSELNGQNEEAVKLYELSIAKSGDTLPVTATTGLVRLLMKQGQYDAALEKIDAFQGSAGNAKGYLNVEREQLETYLSKQAKGSHGRGHAKKHVASI